MSTIFSCILQSTTVSMTAICRTSLGLYRMDYGDGIILQLFEAEFSGTAYPGPKEEPIEWGNPKRGMGDGRAERLQKGVRPYKDYEPMG